MKTNWLANQDARKFKALTQYKLIWGSILFIGALLLVISCTKNDNLELIDNGLSSENDLPIDNDPPIVNIPPNNYGNIIYTDIDPDFNSENVGDVYNLDLNNDGIVDFTFSSYPTDTWTFWAEPNLMTNGVNAFETVSGPFWSYIVPLNKENIISQDLEYPYYYDPTQSLLVLDFCNTSFDFYCSYSWGDNTDKYLGLRFIINEQIHYGWARLYVKSATEWIIKDYAYNATPNALILAGQKE